MLTGVGVLLIGIAFLIISIFLARALNNVAGVLKGVEKTVDQLPNHFNGVLEETGNLIHESNRTLADLNNKLEQLNPLFYIIEDTGNMTRKVSSSMLDFATSVKKKSNSIEHATKKNNVGGLYGSFAFGYYLWKKRKN
ncbi:DUF948 domain-containing protein [Paraliobacillus salinarum]|uniref:DUF948 domain-containing protein n=1 Tax=Paraliobacillus salinarum TaxID=1158996 RepID=UPI001FE90D72|nr:DUF948 domain-containing protein [Paraliobacillus salinarum]